MLVLGTRPAVKDFVHHQQSETVACLKERTRRRIMRRAHGVEPGGLQQFRFAFLGASKRRGPKWAVVVMHVAAVQFERQPIEFESALRRDVHGANAECRADFIPVSTSGRHPCDRAIKCRALRRPQQGVLDQKRVRNGLDLLGGNRRTRQTLRHEGVVCIKHGGDDLHLLGASGAVVYFGRDFERRVLRA